MFTKTYLEKLELHQVSDLAKFIVNENFKHHCKTQRPSGYEEDIACIYNEEKAFYKDSEVYVTKDNLGTINGAIRVLKWNYTDVLPLQKIFGINPFLVINNPNVNAIYHIGRFAIKQELRDISLLKQLMVCAISPICKHRENIAFAECDSKLLRTLRLLGIKVTEIGASVHYLGSETVPIVMDYRGLISFYSKYKYLTLSI